MSGAVNYRIATSVVAGNSRVFSNPARLARDRDYYAAVSFNDAPGGRRIMIGWMNDCDYANLIPSSPWRGPMA